MYGFQSKFAVGLLAGCCFAVNFAYASQRHGQHKPAKVEEPAKAEEVAAEAGPAAPLTLQEMPATPPQVSYQNGKLTIVAKNSTLGDILQAVHTQTGATVDMPGNASERVVGHMGPGSAHDVLAQLLNGSHFNYVILGSAADSSKIERVVLTPKPAPAPENSSPAPVNVATAPAASETPVANQGTPDAASEDDDDSSDAQSSAEQAPTQAPTQAPVRTPEQLLQELQRQQEQQQQSQTQTQPQQQTEAPPGHRD